MPIEYTIFRKIEDIRQDLDMKQKDIAEKMKIKQGVYSRWESGKEIIPFRRLNQFCNITGYKMDYVMGLTTDKRKTKIEKEIDLKECGKRLRKWRTKVGLSQKQLANYLNTTQSTISAYESGKVLILTAFAYQIAKKYKVSLDWLAGRTLEENVDKS